MSSDDSDLPNDLVFIQTSKDDWGEVTFQDSPQGEIISGKLIAKSRFKGRFRDRAFEIISLEA